MRAHGRKIGSLAAVLMVALRSVASAHAILMQSTPGAGCVVPAGAELIRLRYNSLIDAGRSRVTLTGPASTAVTLPVGPTTSRDSLEGHATLVLGSYTLKWQVLALDGHITRGIVNFGVGPGPNPCARPPAG